MPPKAPADADIYHPDFKAMPYWWEAYMPTAQDPLDVPRAGAGGHRRRRLCRAVHRAGSSEARRGLRRSRSGRTWLRCQHAQRRRRQRRGEHRQKLFRQDAGPRIRTGAGGAGGRRRCVRIDRAPDRRARHRLPLAEDRPFRRRLDADAFCRPGEEARAAERSRALRGLHGAARTSARGDGERLLLRRHGGGAIGQSAPGAVLQGPAGCVPRPRCPGLRTRLGHRDHRARRWLAGADHAWRGAGGRSGDRHQRLHRRCHAGAEAARRAVGQPYHRDRGIAAGSGCVADPEATYPVRYAPRAVLLPDVARRQADDLRWAGTVHAGHAADTARRSCTVS